MSGDPGKLAYNLAEWHWRLVAAKRAGTDTLRLVEEGGPIIERMTNADDLIGLINQSGPTNECTAELRRVIDRFRKREQRSRHRGADHAARAGN